MNKTQIKFFNGFPLFSILTIIFVIAKITGYLDWSWWLVLLPLWGPFAIVFAIPLSIGIMFGAAFLFACFVDWFNGLRRRARRLNK